MTETEILIDEYGIPEPKAEDYESSEAFWAAHDAWFEGFSAWVLRKREAEIEEAARIAAEEEAARIAAEEEAARIAAEEEAARIAAEEEAARIAAEEEAARAAAEEKATQIVAEEVSADPEQGRASAPSDRYSVGVYVAEFPLEAKPYDPGSVGSYVDAAGNLWSANGELMSPGTTPAMEPGVEELAGEIVGEPVTGEPVIDTALLLLDLMDALTGEEGTVSDVDEIQRVLDHPLMTTSFQDYTVTEGLLLLLLLSLFMAACAKMLKGGFSWLR